MRRTTRKTGLVDKTPVLNAMAGCRQAMVTLRQSYAFKTAIYREAGSLIEQMDDMALLLTGKRDYFLPRPHATHGGGHES